MASNTYFVYQTPMGRMTLATDGTSLIQAEFGAIDLPYEKRATALTNTAATQLLEYLAGKRKAFDIPLAAKGTDFQKQVWEAIAAIPYGETRTYKELALSIGNPNGFRAVGMAANRNPLPIFVPCHRVIGSAGDLVGYAGGLKIKEFLLNLEHAG